jgi:magnesium transporter
MRNKELTQLQQWKKASSIFHLAQIQRGRSEKMLKLEAIKRFEEDQDLLEDVIIENKQAIEMTNIYSSILTEPWTFLPP